MQFDARACLTICKTLQTQYKRWGHEHAVGELIRRAVLDEASRDMVIAVCRLLFTPKSGGLLRPPRLGEPAFIGDTTSANWPLEPLHVVHGVPFFVVRQWSLAGLPEPATSYLAYCLMHGSWNEKPYEVGEQKQLEDVAEESIKNGPCWGRRPLTVGEREFLLSQVQSTEPVQIGSF